MSQGAIIGGQRIGVRALSLLSSALLVAIACVLLVLASRIPANLDDPAGEGVYATIEERPRQDLPARRLQPPTRTADPSAEPTPTPISVDRAMLARSLACLNRRPEDRPANCPAQPAPERGARLELPVGGDFQQPEEPDLNALYTRAEIATLITPSCRRDGGGGACIPVGPRPPPPSRSGEEVCRAEGIGPCGHPPFREEDVSRRQHTQ